jgi:hypothetical protein
MSMGSKRADQNKREDLTNATVGQRHGGMSYSGGDYAFVDADRGKVNDITTT